MRRLLVASACVMAGAVHLAISLTESAPTTTLVRIGACTLRVDVADTAARRSTGLSHTDAPTGDGLLLRWERPGLHAIWMRDMRYALDLAWIDEAHVIRAICERVPPCADLPCPVYAPPGAASAIAVLETPSGRLAQCAIRVRDQIAITDTTNGGQR